MRWRVWTRAISASPPPGLLVSAVQVTECPGSPSITLHAPADTAIATKIGSGRSAIFPRTPQ
jgi:hypothetical protein